MTARVLQFLLVACYGCVAACAAPPGPPPGKLIPVRGHNLHLLCEGTGTLTVILHPGTGEFSFDWDLVLHRIAKVTRVCAWDRAGYAWSDMSSNFERFGPTAEDLHDLLEEAHENPPYVLVGHGFGGLYIRDYQRHYPEQVSGLVLVDATPEEDHQVGMFGNQVSLIDMADHDLVAWPIHPFAPSRTTPPPVLPVSPWGMEAPFQSLSRDLQRDRRWALGRFLASLKNLTPAESLAIMESQRATFIDLYNARHNTQTGLGDLPVVILSRGRDSTPEIRAMQDQLAHLSRNAAHIVAKESGTQIQIEDPALVAGAILRLVGRK